MATLGEILVKFRADFGTFDADLARGITRMNAFGLAARGMGGVAAGGIGVAIGAIVGLGVASIKTAAEFEQAFASVRRVTQATAGEFEFLRERIVQMSTAVPIAATELMNFAAVGAQMGVPVEQLAQFTDVVAKLSLTAEMSGEKAATMLARMATVTGGAFSNMGSALVATAAKYNATGAEVMQTTRNFMAAGHHAGMSSAAIIGIGTAIMSVGLRAEAGGTAMARLIEMMDRAAARGGAASEKFAKVFALAGNTKLDTGAEFSKAFKADSEGTLVAFFEALGKASDEGKNLTVVLDELGIKNVRIAGTVKSLAAAHGQLSGAMRLAKDEYAKNSALDTQSAVMTGTLSSDLAELKGAWKALMDEFGRSNLAPLAGMVNLLNDSLKGLRQMLQDLKGSSIGDISSGFGMVKGIWDKASGLMPKMGPERVELAPRPDIDFGAKAWTAINGAGGFTGIAAKLMTPEQPKIDPRIQIAAEEAEKQAVKFKSAMDSVRGSISVLQGEARGAWDGIVAGINAATAASIEHVQAMEAEGEISAAQAEKLTAAYQAEAKLKKDAATKDFVRSNLGYARGDAQSQVQSLLKAQSMGPAMESSQAYENLGKKLQEARDLALQFGDALVLDEGTQSILDAADAQDEFIRKTEAAADAAKRQVEAFRLLGPSAADLSDQLMDVYDALGEGDASSISTGRLVNAFGKVEGIRDSARESGNADQEIEAMAVLNGLYDELSKRGALPEINDQTKEVTKETLKWQDAMQGINALMQALGISAGSLPGILMSATTAIGGLADQVSKGGGLGKIFSDLKGGSGLKGIMGSLGMAGQALAIGTTLFKGIKGLFSTPSWVKVGKEAGSVLGVAVGEEMAKKIEEKAKKLGISVKNAALLSLPDAMKDSGKDARTFGGQALSLLDAIKNKSVPAAEGMKALEESFSEISKAAMDAGDVGSNAMVALLVQARLAGKETKGMKDFTKGQLDASVGGVNQAFGTKNEAGDFVGLEMGSQASATAQATIFSTTFWALVKERGVIGAADAMKSTFAMMKERAAESGFDVAAIFAPIERLMNYADDPKFRGAADGANGLNEALKGLANSGYMTREAFSAFGVGAQDAFAQALAATGDQRLALEAIAPLLGSLKQAAANYGVELDGPTSDLIRQAEEAGIEFPEEPLQRIADILESIAKVLGAEIPAAAARADAAISNISPPREGMAGFGGPEQGEFGFPETPPDVTAASGFGPVMLKDDTLIQAHKGEMAMIVPANMATGMRLKTARAGMFNPDIAGGGDGGGGGLPAPGSLGGGGGDGGGGVSNPGPSGGEGGASVPPEVVEQQSAQIERLTSAIEMLATRESKQVLISSSPQIQIDENPLRSREAAAELRRVTLQEVEKAIRLGEGTLVDTIKQALNL